MSDPQPQRPVSEAPQDPPVNLDAAVKQIRHALTQRDVTLTEVGFACDALTAISGEIRRLRELASRCAVSEARTAPPTNAEYLVNEGNNALAASAPPQEDAKRLDHVRAKIAGMLCRGPVIHGAKGHAPFVCMEAQQDGMWVRLPDVLEVLDELSPTSPTEPAEAVKVIYDRGGQDAAWAIVAAIRDRTPYRVVELAENESCGHPDCQTPGACPQCRTITIPPDRCCPDCGNGKRFAPGNEHCVGWHTWPAKRPRPSAPSSAPPGEKGKHKLKPDDQQNAGADGLATCDNHLPDGAPQPVSSTAQRGNGSGVTSAGGESGLPHQRCLLTYESGTGGFLRRCQLAPGHDGECGPILTAPERVPTPSQLQVDPGLGVGAERVRTAPPQPGESGIMHSLPAHQRDAKVTRPSTPSSAPTQAVPFRSKVCPDCGFIYCCCCPASAPTMPKIVTEPGDWPEDFAHENGQYYSTCRACQQPFKGHKRRVHCKTCASAPTTEEKS